MGKDTMEMISLAAATPAYVESFRYQDGGMEKNVQDEFDARNDHIQVSRVVNWELFKEDDYGLSGWTPTNSLNTTAEDLVLSDSKYELYIDVGLAYIGGRRYVRETKNYIDDGTSDPGSGEVTYNIYLKYTENGDLFLFDITTATRTDDHLTKYLIVATADWVSATGWEGVVDLRASNTSLGAPATVSGSDAGAIFTVENTGAGDGLLVKNSDAVIGESGTPQQLVIQGDGTKALTIYSGANSFEVICSAADQMKIQTLAGADAELIVKTLNGMVVGSGIVTTGSWTATPVAAAYIGDHNHTSGVQGGDYAWADITGFGGEPGSVSSGTSGQAGTATTVSRGDHNHDLGVHDHKSAGAGGDYAWADITGFGGEPGVVSSPTSGTAGTATTISRSDHSHDLIADPTYSTMTLSSDPSTPPSGSIRIGEVDMSSVSGFKLIFDNGGTIRMGYRVARTSYQILSSTHLSLTAATSKNIILESDTTLCSSKDIIPELANSSDLGTDLLYFRDIFCSELNYITLDPSPWDHVDDLAIIKSIRPHETNKTRNGRPEAVLTGLPKEIYDPKTKAMNNSGLNMLLIGAIKQLTLKVEELELVIDAHMDAA